MLLGMRVNPAASPSVQALFAAALNDWNTLTTTSTMPTGGSISRAGNAYYFDNTGTLQTASANTARFDCAWNGSTWAAKGLLIEGARTNVFLNSASPATQSITVTAQAYTLSFYGTGTITLSGVSTAGPLVGTGANNRVTLTFTPTAGSLTLTLSGTITYPQLEAGSFASSYIVCGGTATTRNAETFAITGYSSNLINATYIDEGTGVTSVQPYNAGVAPSPSFAWLTALRVYTNAYAGSIASPSWLSFSRSGGAMMTDSTGKLVWAPENILLNSATLSTQSVVTTGTTAGELGTNYVLSFYGTGSVTLSGTGSGTLAGTGASNRVSLAFNATYGTLTLTVSGSVTNAQLERVTYATSPSAYLPTTSSAVYLPRYDFDASTVPATPRGLLIEESRANILTYSDTMSSGWNTANATFSQASVTSPAGTGTVAQVGSDGTAAYKGIYLTPLTTTAGGNNTLSVYVKANTLTRMSLAIINGVNDVRYWYDLSAKTVGGAIASFTTGYVSSSIQDVGNGWLRCTLTATGPTTVTGAYIYPGKADVAAAGNVYVWGAQLEANASFATSYIPNNSSATSVTRAADVAQLTGSALTVLQGTKASALIQTSNVLTNANAPILGQASGVGNAITLYYRNASSPYTASTYNATTVLNDGNITNLLTSNRVGVAWDASGRSVVGNNGTVVTDANSIGSLSAGGMELGHASAASTTYLCGYVASLALYNQRLPDAILKQKSQVGGAY